MNTQKQIIIIVALFFLTVGACAGYTIIELPYRTELQADWHEAESIERGALLYANNCRTCHGNAGEGFVGPRLNRDDFKDQTPLALDANRHMIERTLLCGRAGTLMPAWLSANGGSLNDRQIEHLVNFLTAPLEEGVEDEDGLPTNHGWLEAVEFAHNLNHELTVLVAGDTLQNIAAQHRIGIAELAEANGLPADDPELLLENGAELEIPPVGGAPDGGEYTVEGDNVTLRRAAEATFFGAALLADFNNLEYEIDFDELTFTLLDGGETVPGLLTDAVLALPEGSVYIANSGDTLETVAELHGISVDALLEVSPDLQDTDPTEDLAPADEEGVIPVVVLDLPAVDSYQVRGQSWDDIAEGYGNVTGASLAEANDLTTDDVLRVGQALGLPEDAYGTAPPDTINRGTACVEFAVPTNIYEAIVSGGPIDGGGEPFEGTITADDTFFVQTQITLPPGEDVTVTFENVGALPHNVEFFNSPTPGQGGLLEGCVEGCVDDGTEVRTQISPPGPPTQVFTFTTPEPGAYSYWCVVHPQQMTGTLTIEEGAEIP